MTRIGEDKAFSGEVRIVEYLGISRISTSLLSTYGLFTDITAWFTLNIPCKNPPARHTRRPNKSRYPRRLTTIHQKAPKLPTKNL